MKTYEITYISQEETVKEVKETLDGLSTKILSTTPLGEKQFTYPIKKETKGFYTTVLFESEPDKILELSKKLSLTPEILRFLIINIKPSNLKVETAKEIPALKELEKIAPKEEKIAEEIKAESVKETAEPEVEPVKEVEKVEVKEEKKVEKKKVIEKPAKDIKKEKIIEKPISKEVTEIEEETESEEDRLKALDKKLDELLKD